MVKFSYYKNRKWWNNRILRAKQKQTALMSHNFQLATIERVGKRKGGSRYAENERQLLWEMRVKDVVTTQHSQKYSNNNPPKWMRIWIKLKKEKQFKRHIYSTNAKKKTTTNRNGFELLNFGVAHKFTVRRIKQPMWLVEQKRQLSTQQIWKSCWIWKSEFVRNIIWFAKTWRSNEEQKFAHTTELSIQITILFCACNEWHVIGWRAWAK